MSDIKFACPDCGQSMTGDAEIERQVVTCPSCRAEFEAGAEERRKAAAAAEDRERFAVYPKGSQDDSRFAVYPRDRSEAGALRTFADRLVIGSVVCFVVTGLAVVAAMAGSMEQKNFEPALWVAGAACGLGLWVCLIAQLMHIRAALSRG